MLKAPPATTIRFARNNRYLEWVNCHRVDLLVDGRPMKPRATSWHKGTGLESVHATFDLQQMQMMASASTVEFRICSTSEDIDGGELAKFQRFLRASINALQEELLEQHDGNATAAGSERGVCYGNGTCNTGLTCLSNLCVNADPQASASVAQAPSSVQACDPGSPGTCEKRSDSGKHECEGGPKCRELASELLRQPNPDGELVASLLLKACKLGEIEACTELAFNRTLGKIMPKDYGQAAGLLKGSCERGDARACAFLGAAFEFGRGLPADPDAARDSYAKACRAGYERACQRLRELPVR